ncbi:MAG TPA: hypothetical protein PLQ00_01735, partial [Thermoguttaceae bacterium]|nr:hypothetical protein [Thermoguttaceae bacterium]
LVAFIGPATSTLGKNHHFYIAVPLSTTLCNRWVRLVGSFPATEHLSIPHASWVFVVLVGMINFYVPKSFILILKNLLRCLTVDAWSDYIKRSNYIKRTGNVFLFSSSFSGASAP